MYVLQKLCVFSLVLLDDVNEATEVESYHDHSDGEVDNDAENDGKDENEKEAEKEVKIHMPFVTGQAKLERTHYGVNLSYALLKLMMIYPRSF